MIPNLLVWLVAAPVLAAIVAPIAGAVLGSARRTLYPVAHLLVLVLATQALRLGSASQEVGIAGSPIDARDVLTLDRAAALALVLVAGLFLAIGTYSTGFVGDSRQGSTFLSLLLLEQAAVNAVLLAGGLFALYASLLFLSFGLVAMIGLDFARGSASAVLRVFATAEAPAAVALAAFWLIDARAGTVTLADLPRQAPWLADRASLVLVLPIVVALVARAGLLPFQQWVVTGCRASAVPAATAIAGLAVPLGGLILARVVGLALPVDPSWLHALAFLGALSALVAALGALRAGTALGWLGSVAIAQVGFAIAGFMAGTSTGPAAGWLALASGAVAVVLTGLGLGLAMRATKQEGILGPADVPASWVGRLSLGVGLLAAAGLPPFPSFTARWLLLAGLLDGRSTLNDGLAALVIVASLALAASGFRALFGWGRAPLALDGHANGSPAPALPAAPVIAFTQRAGGAPAPEAAAFVQREPELIAPLRAAPAGPWVGSSRSLDPFRLDVSWRLRQSEDARPDWEMLGPLGGLAILIAGAGMTPLAWLGAIFRVSMPIPSATMGLVATAVLLLALGGALGLHQAWDGLARRARHRKWPSRRLVRLRERCHFDVATDPYLLVGGLLVGLGRASAAIVNHTLGHLARAG